MMTGRSVGLDAAWVAGVVVVVVVVVVFRGKNGVVNS